MKLVRFLILLAFFFVSVAALADKNKSALKALQKGELAKAEMLVQQSLADEVANPGANYLYSVIYVTDSFPRHNIDSAQAYILEALRDWQLLQEKEQEKNRKRGFYPEIFQTQKQRVDSLAFERAKGEGSVASYEFFISRYADAEKVPEAVALRDSTAFENASFQDTWEAYKAFFETYPDAKQVPEAEERYKDLVFKDLTRDRKLSSFKEFLVQFPATPYRREAEEQIFEIMTASGHPETYLQFIGEYPRSFFRKKALDFLYSLDQGAYDFRYYPRYTLARNLQDSLDRLRRLESVYLVPVYERGSYGFIDPSGSELFPPAFSAVPDRYLCGSIADDFLFVEKDGEMHLINRQGGSIAKGDFDFAENLGFGLIKAGKGEKSGVWHKGGHQVLAQQYDDVQALGNSLLKIVQDEKAGLATLTGRVLLPPQFDDIAVDGSFWVFVKDDRLAFASLERIAAIADQQPLALEFAYEELERLPGGYMLAYDGDTETLINEQQEVVIPKAVQNIYPMGENWLIRQPFGYRIFYPASRSFTEQLFPEVEFNSQWLALKSDSAWALVYKESAGSIMFNLDSAKLITEDVALSFQGVKGTLHFALGKRVEFQAGDKVYVLEEGYARENYKSDEHFLVLETSRGKQVFSMEGKPLFELKTGNLRYLSPEYLVLEVRGKFGIIDTTGAQRLPAKYEGIGQADAEGFVTVLDGGKFGSFHLKSGTLAPPKYDTRVRHFNETHLKTSLKAKAGLISYDGKTVLPFEYDEVLPWNDSLVMVKKGEQWRISSLDGKKSFYQPFASYQPIRESKAEKVLKIYAQEGYGILSSVHGMILAPTYNDLLNLGTDEQPLYFAEKHVKEAEFFVVVYTDAKGNPVRSQAFRAEEYDKIFCE